MTKTQPDLTAGSISGHLLRLSIPLVISNVLYTAYNLINMLWVSRLGSVAIGAIAMSAQAIFVIQTMIIGIGIGTQAIIARNIGAGKTEQAEATVWQSLWLGLVLSIPLALIGWIFSSHILQLMQAPPEIISAGDTYLKISLIGGFVMFNSMLISSIHQGTGNTIIPMFMIITTTVLNTILDPLLIFGPWFFPAWGVSGAAVASLLSGLIGCLIGFGYFFNKSSIIHLKLKNFSVNGYLTWQIIRIGFPTSIQMSLRGFMAVILMSIVATFGTYAVSAYGIFGRIMMVVLMPGFGIGGAAATMVGQNLGADQPKRAVRSAWMGTLMYSALMLIFAVISWFWAPSIIAVFDNHPTVIAIGTKLLQISAWGYLFTAIGITLSRAMNGAGDTVSTMLFTLIALWGVQIPLAIYLGKYTTFGIDGVWYATLIATILQGSLTLGWFSLGRWHKVQIR